MNKKAIILSAAVMALLPASKVFAADMQTTDFDWTGFYAGVTGGYDWGHSDRGSYNSNNGALDSTGGHPGSGVFGGPFGGYNFMLPNRIVLGAEADVFVNGSSGTETIRNASGSNVSVTNDNTDWSGTVRSRLGYAFDRTLIFGTAGFAWAHVNAMRTQNVGRTGAATPGTVESSSAWVPGAVIGAGIEEAFTPNLIGRVQYLYTVYSDRVITAPVAQRYSNSAHDYNNQVQLGIAYKF